MAEYQAVPPARPVLNGVLWTLQILLTLLFLFAGISKLVLPVATLTKGTSLSGGFMRFIGVAETLGGLGLILPGLCRIRPGLTPLAGLGLVIIMAGATVISVQSGPVALAAIPGVTGLLLAFVAYGRWKLLPHRSR